MFLIVTAAVAVHVEQLVQIDVVARHDAQGAAGTDETVSTTTTTTVDVAVAVAVHAAVAADAAAAAAVATRAMLKPEPEETTVCATVICATADEITAALQLVRHQLRVC